MCPPEEEKKEDTYSSRALFSSRRVGVNIYLQFLVKEEKGIILMSPTSVWSDYPALVFALFSVRACMLDLLLPPKCLGRRGRIILVTHAVSSQFVFGHK